MTDKIFNNICLKVPVLSDNEKKDLIVLKTCDRLYGVAPICIDILYNRGFKTVDDIEKFLYSTMNDVHSPIQLKDADIFISSLIESLENDEEITVYPDYDTDGVTSGSIAVNGIRTASKLINSKSKVNWYTNNRFIEGYGITPKGVEMLLDKFPNTKVIITTDNGIVGFEGIKKAVEMGIKVLVTDHHDQGEKLPELATAIVNPKRKDCPYPFKGLCGAGVIFKLMQLLFWELNLDKKYVDEMIDILAVGTVGDLVPLVDENRIFVKEGIKFVKEERRVAFKKLREALEITSIDEETFGFVYAPLLNALGRVTGSPDDGIELFTTDDEERMEEIVKKLVEMNEYRKELTKEQIELATELADKMTEVPDVVVLAHENFHEGVIGLVATKIRDRFQRPTIILAEHEKEIIGDDGSIVPQYILKGSARSIDGMDIKLAFDNVKDHLLGYGGHYMAGGLSLKKEELDNFKKSINEYAKTVLKPEHYKKIILIDAPLSADSINVDLIEEIQSLKPYGMGFSKPKFGLKNFELDFNFNKKIYIGQEANHVRLVSKEKLSLIMFNGSERYKYLNEPVNIKAVGVPVLNVFNGNVSAQFMVESEYLFKA